MNNNQNININIKVLFIGDYKVGKTSLINTYLGNEFDHNIYPSFLYDHYDKNIIKESKTYRFKIIDIPGSQRYRNMIRPNLRNTKIIVLVFDMTDKRTFLELDNILEIIYENLGNNKFNFILVGNKSDLIDEWQIKEQEGKKFAEILGGKFFLSSAKNGINEFREFLDAYFEEYIQMHKDELELNQQRVNLVQQRRRRRRNTGCY